jgi:hypothetical protein
MYNYNQARELFRDKRPATWEIPSDTNQSHKAAQSDYEEEE